MLHNAAAEACNCRILENPDDEDSPDIVRCRELMMDRRYDLRYAMQKHSHADLAAALEVQASHRGGHNQRRSTKKHRLRPGDATVASRGGGGGPSGSSADGVEGGGVSGGGGGGALNGSAAQEVGHAGGAARGAFGGPLQPAGDASPPALAHRNDGADDLAAVPRHKGLQPQCKDSTAARRPPPGGQRADGGGGGIRQPRSDCGLGC